MTALRPLLVAAALGAATLTAGFAPPRAVAGESTRVRNARAHYEMGVAHYNLDEFPSALAEFREAYRLKPDPSFLFNIAQCHRRLGETDAALDFYRKYLRSLPDAPNRADVERVIAELRARQAPAAPPDAPPTVAPLTPAETPPQEGSAPLAAAPPSAAPAEALVAAPASPATDERRPFYRRWWFWTAIGAVAAGAVVGAYVATRPAPQPYAGTLDPHVFEVR